MCAIKKTGLSRNLCNMPEIAEVARIVHFLKAKLVGKRISTATALDDANVFGKVGTTGADVQKALTGRTVMSAGSQGKYFWITLDKPPHLVMHFGMTGWVHIQGEKTAYTNYYKKMKDTELEDWPPRFWKFHLETDTKPPVKVAYTDARRFGRVRLVDCPGEDIRQYSPLVENGPDPVNDLDVFTEQYLRDKMRARRVPVKALLLDQTTISGIGNWVADEALYQAKQHPEQYCNTFNNEEIKTLFDSIRYVCQTAVDHLGDSDAFPEDWLFNHRWGKGSKEKASQHPNGEKLAFITVGGRTSCYAPERQKKTGKVDPKAEDTNGDGEASKPSGKRSRKRPQVKLEDGEEGDGADVNTELGPPAKKSRKTSPSEAGDPIGKPSPKGSKIKSEAADGAGTAPPSSRRKPNTTTGATSINMVPEPQRGAVGRRKSARLRQ
ncbi:Formamidopyrimidine-DNA glycosylase N-terminal domain-containing protein [Emericellopsis atlantica]|uniref:Formamidopyrimidine-DNA glycosylase N-terminal domain-containing protein n=1 Tax=Emericellopsis atlantica TaxID=2614577 RepID=A0A9P7ZN05_9HYPO|nr:Formamidopyrimidine-DNA glycosylase N-terminal domain-containing protein [Emericellopsis atlantica]KAG9254692.1 Formamidopyrimidine-DNA glycosylase N-terminal domain-containing protein [Emericellopsis atlantica]